MIFYKVITAVPLDPGDEVVAATPFRGYVLVFTRGGDVIKIGAEPHDD